MNLERFAKSRDLSIAIELELQIVSTDDRDLAPMAADVLYAMRREHIPGTLKAATTRSMIAVSTGFCEGHAEALTRLQAIRDALVRRAAGLDLRLCGGGTHPFQDWIQQRIYDTRRFSQLHELYAQLAKQFTIFGQHVHVGCPSPDESLELLHGLSRFMPHLIALSASSPFSQGADTAFDSSRLNSVFGFPLSGRAPFFLHWEDYERYLDKVSRTGVVRSMMDFQWDARPNPELGAVEVRALDAPLTVEKAAALAGYIQCLARWLRLERPFVLRDDDYLLYTFNRFEACRFGLDANYIDPGTGERHTLREHILNSINRLEGHAMELDAEDALALLRDSVLHAGNDASWVRAAFDRCADLSEVVDLMSLRWAGNPA